MATLALQGARGQEAAVIGVNGFSHAVANLENSIDYYEQALGYEVLSTVPPRVAGKIGPNVYDRALQALMDVGGAYYRVATLQAPGGGQPLRLFELRNNQTIVNLRAERQGAARLTDVGGLALRLEVPNLRAVSRSIRDKYLGDVLTLSRALDANEVEAFAVRDDEGFVLHMVQAPKGATADARYRAGITLTTANLESKLHFYRDLLGIQFETSDWDGDRTTLAALGASGGRVKHTQGTVPGTDVTVDLLQFADLAQRRFYPAVMGQAGVGWLSLFVRDLDELMKVFVTERIRVVSTGLQPVDFTDSRRVAVRDPDGVLVELIETRGATTESAARR